MTAEQTKIAEESHVKAPWLNVYGVVPPHLDYPDCTMYEAVERCAGTYPNHTAYVFMGRKTTYRAMAAEIDLCARALKATGVRPGDRITMAMPNCPQAVIMFYAINLVGATANMIHPLSSEKEIEFYLKESGSIFAVTLDQFYHKFEAIRQNVTLDNIILASIPDALSKPVRVGYMLTEGRKQAKIPKDAPVLRWNEFLRRGRGYHWTYRTERRAGDEAVILYSGGTTGVTKGIQLTNLNFNALGKQIIATNPMFRPGDKMLAVMPMFHGFGLGVSIHSMLVSGGCCILVPRFTPDSYAKLLLKYRCNLIAGVPTLYEALLRLPKMKNADLSCLKGVYSGGDSLSVELKKRFDQFLFDHHATIQVREGYGLTECVTASCLTPYHISREGSIGIPFPDTYYKIVEHGTQKEVPYGTEGETYTLDENGQIVYCDDILNYDGGAQLGAWQYGFFVYGGSFPWRSYDSKTMEHARKNDVEGFTGERFSDYVEDSEKYSAKLMPGMIPTAEEADQVSPFLTDSDSYVQEARMKFVTGQWNFDSDWDAYVNQLNAMGAEDYVTVKQAQYDRYLSK